MKTEKLKRITVPVEVVLGRTDLSLDKIGDLAVGAIVELNAPVGEPVYLKASGTTIGKGEVVVINDNFGLRITEITDAKESQ